MTTVTLSDRSSSFAALLEPLAEPLGFEAGDANVRRYVGNSPTNATDPSGLETYFPADFDAKGTAALVIVLKYPAGTIEGDGDATGRVAGNVRIGEAASWLCDNDLKKHFGDNIIRIEVSDVKASDEPIGFNGLRKSIEAALKDNADKVKGGVSYIIFMGHGGYSQESKDGSVSWPVKQGSVEANKGTTTVNIPNFGIEGFRITDRDDDRVSLIDALLDHAAMKSSSGKFQVKHIDLEACYAAPEARRIAEALAATGVSGMRIGGYGPMEVLFGKGKVDPAKGSNKLYFGILEDGTVVQRILQDGTLIEKK